MSLATQKLIASAPKVLASEAGRNALIATGKVALTVGKGAVLVAKSFVIAHPIGAACLIGTAVGLGLRKLFRG